MKKRFLLGLTAILNLLLIPLCAGESYGPVDLITPTSKNELWINPGLYSYHFDRDSDFNSFNYGFGAEYKFLSIASVTAGTFRNSNYQQSSYLGAYWQPIRIGHVQVGVVVGAFNGYSNSNNGGWFPAALPAFTIEGDLLGLNLLVIPTIPNRVSGSLSFQLKVKVFD